MASHTAMLLDPRAYRKQLRTPTSVPNGNADSPDLLPRSASKGPDTTLDHNNPSLFPSFINSCCPSPPDDRIYSSLDPAERFSQSFGLLVQGAAAGQSDSGHATPPSIAPAGTVAAAQHLLDPQRRPSSRARTTSAKSRPSQRDSSRLSGSRSAGNGSPQRTAKPSDQPVVDVEFATPREIENGGVCDDKMYWDRDTTPRRGLIEDMYGVERRGNQPRKRIKTVDPWAEEKQAAKRRHLLMAGNNGLGEWMKEDPGESRQTIPAVSNVVDLTLEAPSRANDDDDLQVTGSNNLSVQRVCYGKLENASVQAIMVPRPPPQNVFGDSPHDWPSIKLGVHRTRGQGNNRIDVSDPHGKIFGAIDARTAGVIVPLLDSPALSVDITARLDVRKRQPDEWPWDSCSAFYRASVNLYGLRKDADLVSRHLGQNNIWLGTPNSVEQGVPVFNPHAERRRAQASFLPAVAARGRAGVNYEVRTAEEVNDAVMKMFDQLQSAENLPEMETPSILSTPLLRHQRQALWFMTEKEKPRKFGPKEEDNNSLWRVDYRAGGGKRYREIISGIILDEEPQQSLGGLLADMMGLGKTLSILSLVASSLNEAGEWAKKGPPSDLASSLPNIHNTRTTLLVVPLSAVNNWVAQIKEHVVEDGLSYYVFHGSSRTSDVDKLSQYDLVITTYSIILSELSGRGKRGATSPLTKMNMFRIVLDEAHTIREQSAAQTQAIFKLNSQRRWSVTGTPIQNRLEDLLSVTKFLGLFPYDDRSRFGMYILSRFKTGDATVLASLRVLVDSFTLRRVKDKVDIPARHDKIITLDFSEKERQLHEFFRKESNVVMSVIAGQDKTRIKGRMYHHVLKAMMILRQISAHGKELLEPEDRERIKGVSANDAIDLEEHDGDMTTVHTDKKAYEMFTLMQQSSADVCAVCSKRLEEPSMETGITDKKAPMAIVLPCFDVLCADCFHNWKEAIDSQHAQSLHDMRCPVCAAWIQATYSTITPAGLQDYETKQAEAKQSRKHGKALGEYEEPHTKTKALIASLTKSAEESKPLEDAGERPIKSVVFSAWTSHLDLLEIALRDNNLTGYTRLDGTMSLGSRHNALEDFHTNSAITVLLATIGAGGVGLNLTSASNVYIMEPQYNPAAVAQAVDRVHRLGQTREVTTVQFIMRGSIEEKISELAKKKQQLADLSMNRGKLDKREAQEERMREYRELFK